MHQKRAFVLFAAALFVLPCFSPVTAQKADEQAARLQRIENGLLPAVVVKVQTQPVKLSDQMAKYKVPGVSVAVINNGKLEWAKGYGVAETGGTTPITPETLFQAASISKPVAALAALALVEQGKLGLDENVNAKLKSWQVPENDFTKEQKVTLRRLLSHSAGLTVHGFRGYASDETVPTVVQILNGEKPANSAAVRADLVPGSKWRYAGGGYTVMQQLLLDVTGKPFPHIVRELVLDKLGLKHSTYEQPLPATLTATAATGHRAQGPIVKGKWHTYPEMAAAGLWTTPSDLARIAIELQQAYAGKSNKVLSQAMVKQMLTKESGTYGLGFGLAGEGKTFTFNHGGSNEGFKCMLVAFAETGQGAVVMTNGDQGSRLAEEVLRAIAREYAWPARQAVEREPVKVDPALYAEYAGEYEFRPGQTRPVLHENGKLFIAPTPSVKFELFPTTATRFFIESDASVWHSFNRNAAGKVSELVIEVNGSKTVLKRMGLTPKITVNDFSWLLGTWKHESATSTTYESWRKLSDKTLEGESWRVNKTTQQKVFGEALLLAEMGGEIFYLPKTSDNPMPVAFKLTQSNAQEVVFENPKHDFPQKIHYKLNADGTVTARVEGQLGGQQRQIEFRYSKTTVAPQ
jgi:CubicO group peptidase (beta-lactamase class C family)